MVFGLENHGFTLGFTVPAFSERFGDFFDKNGSISQVSTRLEIKLGIIDK